MSNYADYHPCYFHCFIKDADPNTRCGGHLCGRITWGMLIGLKWLLIGILGLGLIAMGLLLIGFTTEFVFRFSPEAPMCDIRNAGTFLDFNFGLCVIVGLLAVIYTMVSFMIFNILIVPLYVYLEDTSKIWKIMVCLIPVYIFGIQIMGLAIPHIFNQPKLHLKCNITSYYTIMNQDCLWMGAATWGVILSAEYLVILIWFIVQRYGQWYEKSKVYQKTYGSIEFKA